MIYAGTILDSATETPIPYASVRLFLGETQVAGQAADEHGRFSISTEIPVDTITVSAAEYNEFTFPASTFQQRFELEPKPNDIPPVVVHSTIPGQKPNNWLLVAAIVVIIAAIESQRKGKKLGKIEKGDVTIALMIIGGLLGWTVVNKILQKLGITDGPGAKKVKEEQTNPYSAWKPNFWKAAPQGTTVTLIREADVQDYIKKIHNAFGIFQDDFNVVMNVFSQLKTKSQLSYLADKFQQRYDEDLLSFLTDGGGILPWDGFSDSNLKKLADLADSLPQYQPR